MANTKDYKNGYQAAIEALKKHLNGQGDADGDSSQNTSGMISPEEATGKPSKNSSSSSSSSSSSRTSSGDPNQGVVRPEDCVGPSQLNKVPGRAGGMIDKKTGNDICEKEGYKKDNSSDAANEKDWQEAALKEIPKLPTGEGGPGNLKMKLEDLYKVSMDWKKALRSIVGHAISPEDKRQAYANKNILISQDRIARTDKDKYDALSYMVIILDTSGSMWNEKIRQMMREAYAVALQKKPMRIVTIQNDSTIQDIQIHNNLKDFEKYVKTIQMKGGGGNDLEPVWKWLAGKSQAFQKEYSKIKKAGAADLVMNFTDGFLKQLKRDPKTMKNLCWAIVDNPGFQLEHKDINTKMIIIKND